MGILKSIKLTLVSIIFLLGFCSEFINNAPTGEVIDQSGCPYAAGLCPKDCGQKVDANGCRKCLCGVPYFRWPVRQCPISKRPCPADCGHTVDDAGCKKCLCGMNPFFRFPWVPMKDRKPILSKNIGKPQQNTEFKLDVRVNQNFQEKDNVTGSQLDKDRIVF